MRREQPEMAGTQEPEQMRLEELGWGQAAAPVCWELDESCSGPGALGLKRPGWNEDPQPGCAAGAEFAGSAADAPSSQRILAAPCGMTGGQPAAADAGIPAAHTNENKTFLWCNEVV